MLSTFLPSEPKTLHCRSQLLYGRKLNPMEMKYPERIHSVRPEFERC